MPTVAADVAWPNLFVVGAGRCGTTSLLRCLSDHHDIYMSPVKEPNFFSPARTAFEVVKDADAYLRLFADAGAARLRGEASVSYFWDEESPAAIRRASPGARIVVSLRDPVARAYSAYWNLVRWGIETRPFREAVADELAGREQDWYPGFHAGYLRTGTYSPAVQRYIDAFPNRVFVLFFDEVVAQPSKLRSLYEFLDVEPPAADALTLARENAAGAPRSRLGRRLLRARWPLPRGARLRSRARSVAERLALGRSVPPLDDDVRPMLERYFEADREPLERLLGRPVPW